MTTEKMSVEQALECLEGIVDGARWDTDHIAGTEALATLRAEVEGLRSFVKECADGLPELDASECRKRAIAIDRAREVPREGE